MLVLNFIEINFEVIDAEEMFLVGGFTNTKLLAWSLLNFNEINFEGLLHGSRETALEEYAD